MPEGLSSPAVGSAKPALVGRPWRPGQSGNPSGANRKQKGLATLIRRSTKQGKELVDFVLDVARGAPIKVSIVTLAGTVIDVERRSTIRDRLEAIAWLADRGWGRAKEVIALEEDGARQGPLLVFLGSPGDPLARAAPRRSLPAAAEETVIEVPRPSVRPATPLPEVAFEMDEATEPPARG